MFLNYRRSTIKYYLLVIFTLTLYHYIFMGRVAKDTNQACSGDGQHTKFNFLAFFFLNIITLNIYSIVWESRVIDRWNNYLQNTQKCINSTKYVYIKFFGSFIVIPALIMQHMFVRQLNRVCYKYSTDIFSDDEDESYYVRPKSQEVPDIIQEDPNIVAGVPVIEEYFEEKHRRRIIIAEEIKTYEPAPKKRKREKEVIDDPIIDTECHYRNRKWLRKVGIPLTALLLAPIIILSVITFALPPVYNKTFIGVLGDKYDLLCKTNKPKVVVIGGSSVAFGLDSELMEEHLGMKVVNFGLYANLGTKLMIDLSKANINKGDIVILAPEMDSQTLSLYFNSETTMQALDGNWGMLRNINFDQFEPLIGASWGFTSNKLNYLLKKERPLNEGAYKKENFNKYGDNIYDRPYNVMKGQGAITLDFMVNYEDSINSEYEQFIDYINEYAKWVRSREATIYFSFPPMCETSMTNKNTDETIYNFYENLADALNFKIISNVHNYIMDEGYFFDSEFHLNNAGITVRTVQLIDDIKRENNDLSITIRKEDLPKPSGFGEFGFVSGNEDNLYFNLELYTFAEREVYMITGLNDLGKTQTELKIPNNVDGIPIARIAESAFADGSVTKLILGENILTIDGMAFKDAASLQDVIVPDSKGPNDISVPNRLGNGILATDGANPNIRIHVSGEYFEQFISDYFWGDYTHSLRRKN